MKYFFLMMFVSLPLFAQELDCDPDLIGVDEISTLAQQIDNVNNLFYKNVLNFNVKMAGEGNISVLTNDKGELEAIRLNYTHKNDHKSFVLDRPKLDRADRISLPGRPGEDDFPPLQFYPVKPPGLDFSRGGAFKISIITEQDPKKTEEYVVNLRKSGPDWILDHNNRRVSKMTLHPGVSFLSWKGTFNRIEFK